MAEAKPKPTTTKRPETKETAHDWAGWVSVVMVAQDVALPLVLKKSIVLGGHVSQLGGVSGKVTAMDLHVVSGGLRLTVDSVDGGRRYVMFYPGGVWFEVAA